MELLERFHTNRTKQIVMVEDCNLIFDSELEVKISNTLREFVTIREILTDHSLVFFSLSKEKILQLEGKDLANLMFFK